VTKQRTYNTWMIYWRVLEEIRPHWGGLAILLALGVLAAPLALLMPLPLKIVVDSVLGSHPLPQFLDGFVPSWLAGSSTGMLWFAVALVVVVALLGLLLKLGNWLLQEYLGEKIVLEFRSKLFEHVNQLSLAQHDKCGGGDLTYRIQYDAPAIRWLVINGALPFITAFLTLFAMIYVIVRLDFRLGVVALSILPAIFVVTQIYSHRLRASWRRVKAAETNALSIVQEVIGAIKVVKAFGQERREQKRLFGVARQGIMARIKVVLAESEFSLLIGITIAAGTATVLFIGAEAVLAGQLTTGDLVLVMAYIAQLYAPVQTMGKQAAEQQGSIASAERAFSILDEHPAIVEKLNATALACAEGNIEFCDVSFSYDTRGRVLHNISFDIPAGATVGIIGKTGSGKTTLVNLLTRFYDPTEGAIFLDGKDLRTYRIADLCNQFSIVLQEPVLFPTTIAENIAYGMPDADESAIIAAAKAANAHEFIAALREGYDTLVGDRGIRLSGGERQRVSLARAFIKDSPLLVLDEPTSSVDTETEMEIMEATLRLIANRTTFIIAHRLSTLRRCDMLLVLDEGCLARIADSPQLILENLAPDQNGEWVAPKCLAPVQRDGTD
jgi:ATP-binding cassette, subfamily B, bacterial